MGQEKSLPDRCNSIQTTPSRPATISSTQSAQKPYTSSASTHHSSGNSSSTNNSIISSRPPSRAPSTTKSCSSLYTTSYSTTSSTSTQKQTKYLKQQLYIKSYLDIVEQDKTARNQFQSAKPGIRNYKPKILVEKPPKKEVDVWI